MDGPPTRMTYSPDGGEADCEPSANSDTKQTSKRRFIMAGEGIIYAAREIAQVAGRVPVGTSRCPDVAARRPYHGESTSPRTKSSHVCRLRISANLSPRTSASAGSGREL